MLVIFINRRCVSLLHTRKERIIANMGKSETAMQLFENSLSARSRKNKSLRLGIQIANASLS